MNQLALIPELQKATTQPTAGELHVNRPLTNFSQKYLMDEESYVASRAIPNLPVTHQSDLYVEWDRDDFLRDEAEERADGTESSGGSFRLSRVPYYARVYAHHKDVTDRQRANADPGINLEEVAAQYVTQKLLIRKEALFAAAFMGTGIWGTDVTPGTKWSAAGGDPILDIRTGRRAIKAATGQRANKAIFGALAWDTFLENDLVLARISGGATTSQPAKVMKNLAAQLLELDEIFVMDAIKTTSVKGAASTTRAFIGSEDAVLLYHAPNSVGPDTVSAAVAFSWTGAAGSTPNGLRQKRFRMEHLETDRIEGQMAFDMKKTSAALGYFINDVTA